MKEKEAAAISIRPSDFVEGGAVPVDRVLVWKENRFAMFDYTKKSGEVVASTVAARVTYVDESDTEYIQHYSVGDPKRFQPSDDGKTLVAVGDAQALSASSNFHMLMAALVNAGFPEDKLTGDISVLDGLVTHNIGQPEPTRSGLARAAAAEGARPKVISIPDKIIKLPWEKKGAAKGVGKAAGTDTKVADAAVAMVKGLFEDGADSVTRKQVAGQAVRAKNADVAKFIYTGAFGEALLTSGYSLDGEDITPIE